MIRIFLMFFPMCDRHCTIFRAHVSCHVRVHAALPHKMSCFHILRTGETGAMEDGRWKTAVVLGLSSVQWYQQLPLTSGNKSGAQELEWYVSERACHIKLANSDCILNMHCHLAMLAHEISAPSCRFSI